MFLIYFYMFLNLFVLLKVLDVSNLDSQHELLRRQGPWRGTSLPCPLGVQLGPSPWAAASGPRHFPGGIAACGQSCRWTDPSGKGTWPEEDWGLEHVK